MGGRVQINHFPHILPMPRSSCIVCQKRVEDIESALDSATRGSGKNGRNA
jgi:hypothetical protein